MRELWRCVGQQDIEQVSVLNIGLQIPLHHDVTRCGCDCCAQQVRMTVTKEVNANANGKVEEPAPIGRSHSSASPQAGADIGEEQGAATQLGYPLELLSIGICRIAYCSGIGLQLSYGCQDEVKATLEGWMSKQLFVDKRHGVRTDHNGQPSPLQADR